MNKFFYKIKDPVFKFLEFRDDNELFREFLERFPEFNEQFIFLELKLRKLCRFLHALYLNRYVNLQSQLTVNNLRTDESTNTFLRKLHFLHRRQATIIRYKIVLAVFLSESLSCKLNLFKNITLR